jgi:hypothetical protein
MATVSFKKGAAPASPKQEEAPVAAVAVREQAGPVAAAGSAGAAQIAGLDGEFGQADIAKPFLSVVSKQSKIMDTHPEFMGKFLYDKTHCLGDVIRVIVFGMRKYYEEQLEEDDRDSIPQRWDSSAEAKASGLQFRDVCDIDLVIEDQTAELSDLARFEHKGKYYLPARTTVRGGAYRNTVGILLRDASGWLGKVLHSGFYEWSTEKKSNDRTTWYVPVVKADGKVPEDLRERFRQEFGVV